jgi:cation:H+ antiporter
VPASSVIFRPAPFEDHGFISAIAAPSAMTASILLLLAAAAAIYFACEFFVNGIEWVGHRLSLGETATGTVLAAFGTALPESVVTLVATAFARGGSPGEAQRQIGIGAALGGPLVLSTLAYALVGLALLHHARRLDRGPGCRVEVDHLRLSRDQAWFLVIFIAKIGLGLAVFALKPWLGVLFLAAYAVYVRRELTQERGAISASHEAIDMEPLKIRPRDAEPRLGWALLQTLAALVVIFFAARIFVGRLEEMAISLGLAPQVAALLLSPIATELPEMMNALIWVRQGKERLALANISGAMMIQATVPTAFGLFFTPWRLDPALLLSAGITAAAVLYLLLAFRRGQVRGWQLAQVGWLYLAFAAALGLLR